MLAETSNFQVMQRSVEDGGELRLTNCALSVRPTLLLLQFIHVCFLHPLWNEMIIKEIVFSGAGMILWMLVCGIGGTVVGSSRSHTNKPEPVEQANLGSADYNRHRRVFWMAGGEHAN